MELVKFFENVSVMFDNQKILLVLLSDKQTRPRLWHCDS